MRFMILIKADKNSEAGVMPDTRLLEAMGQFNEELVKAGVMQAGEGLQPSSKGARVRFQGHERSVVNGPFAGDKGLVAGFWIWKLNSLDEAIAWVKRCPNPTGESSEIEIRQVFEAEDFGAEFTPELREQEDRLRAQIESTQAKPTAAVNPVPPATGSTPYLVIKNAKDAIAWYQKVFGAQVVMQMDAPDGKTMHAELQVGSAKFMLTEERAEHQALSPLTLGGSSSSALLYVPDTDAIVNQAVAAGARVTMPVADQFWGDRSGHLVDPFGHQWFISTHKEDLTPQQVDERLQKMFS
jgi:uncharacterized glyoxalase superfamily protein PhnB